MKQVFSYFAIMTALLFSLGSAQNVRLTVWDQHTGPADPAAEQIYQLFMEQNPDITIEREIFAGQDLNQLVPTALAGGTGPDVMYYDVAAAREVFRAGLILPLDDFAAEYGWRDKFYPAGLQWSVIDGQVAGLGLEYEFVGVFVNDDLMEAEGFSVPSNLEETLAFCQAASEQGYIPFAHGQNPGWQAFFSFTMPVHNTLGVAYMENLLFNGEGDWTNESMVRAVEVVYRDMRDAGCFVDDVNGLDFPAQQDVFFSGEALLLPTGTWVVGEILINMEANVSMVPFPATVAGGDRIYTAGMGSAFFVNSRTEHPEAAARFLDFMFSDEAVKIWIETAGFIPPVPVDTMTLELAPLTAFVLDTLQAAGSGTGDLQLGYNIDLIAPQVFNTMMRDGFQAVMAGTKSPAEQLADLQRLWDER